MVDQSESLEIQRSYVIEESEPEAVKARIQQWQEANGADIVPFLAQRRQVDKDSPTDDILGRMLDVLDVEDMRRLSMPLDIVDKLRRH